MINRKNFFDKVRTSLFGGKLTQEQVDGTVAILNEWEKRELTDNRWLAYMLATAYHEVGRAMVPVREGFKATDTAARRIVARRKYGKEDPKTGHVYYGRGLVQLTWAENYRAMGDILELPLYLHPDLALKPDVASAIMFEGMIRGTFTGKALKTYFNTKTTDWVQARRIINGTDKASTIAGYARKFYAALG